MTAAASTAAAAEIAGTFRCGDATLVGLLHRSGAADAPLCVIVVGGPQYRVGSHRMFLEIGRALAARGIDTFRFDCRGMGDSDGTFETFEALDDDIRAAVDEATRLTGCTSATLLGLCDGASAAAMYAPQDDRVRALALLNPWVRTEQSLVQAEVRHYYFKRLLQPELWRGLMNGSVNVWRSGREFAGKLARLGRTPDAPTSYIERMRLGIEAFRGNTLAVLSGEDLTAQEFAALIEQDAAWRALVASKPVALARCPTADHTFSGSGQIEELVALVAPVIAGAPSGQGG